MAGEIKGRLLAFPDRRHVVRSADTRLAAVEPGSDAVSLLTGLAAQIERVRVMRVSLDHQTALLHVQMIGPPRVDNWRERFSAWWNERKVSIIDADTGCQARIECRAWGESILYVMDDGPVSTWSIAAWIRAQHGRTIAAGEAITVNVDGCRLSFADSMPGSVVVP